MRKLMWLTVGFVAATLVGCNWLDARWYLLAAGAAALVLAICLAVMIKNPKSRVAGMLVSAVSWAFCGNWALIASIYPQPESWTNCKTRSPYSHPTIPMKRIMAVLWKGGCM